MTDNGNTHYLVVCCTRNSTPTAMWLQGLKKIILGIFTQLQLGQLKKKKHPNCAALTAPPRKRLVLLLLFFRLLLLGKYIKILKSVLKYSHLRQKWILYRLTLPFILSIYVLNFYIFDLIFYGSVLYSALWLTPSLRYTCVLPSPLLLPVFSCPWFPEETNIRNLIPRLQTFLGSHINTH